MAQLCASQLFWRTESPRVGTILNRRSKWAAMILSVFGDESADETMQRVFAISGVVGSEREWELAVKAWTERTRGREFHAKECETEYAYDPDRTKHKENLALYKDLTQILAKSYLAGVCIALDLTSRREVFGDALADMEYYKCLADVLNELTIMANKFNEQIASSEHPEDEPVSLEFTFDHRKQSEGNAGTLYSAFINQPEWADTYLLGTKISFDCRTNPRIQMADLLARESMKDLDRSVGEARKPRDSFRALKETGKFVFIQRDRAYFQEWHDRMSQLKAESGMNEQDYVNWLIETGRVQDGRVHDNWGNRFQYYVWSDNRKALSRRRN